MSPNFTWIEKLRKAGERSDEWLCSWPGQTVLLGLLGLVYIGAYQQHDALPGANPQYPLGWWGWWDQSQYLKCAASLSGGILTSDTYWYPLGYPVLGALFYSVMPQHAFLIPNLLLVLGTAGLFFQIARKFIRPLEAILLMAAFIVCYRGLLGDTRVPPTNSISTHFLSYAVILLAAVGTVTTRRILYAAFLVGLMYVCRPGDAFCLALVVGIAVLRLPSWSARIRVGLVAAAIVALFWLIVLLINRSVFQAWVTPYEKVVSSIGFGAYPIWEKVYWLVADNRPVFNEPEATLLSHFPWLLLVIPGVAYLLVRKPGEMIGPLAGIAATYAIYFEFNDFWPSNIFRFALVHYLLWTLPLLALIAYVGIRDAWRTRLGRWSFGLTAMVALALGLVSMKLEVTGSVNAPRTATGQVDAAASAPVDWILFEGLEGLPKLGIGTHNLAQYREFIRPVRSKDVFVLLSKPAREATIQYDTSEAGTLTKVQFGRLRWEFRSPWKALLSLWEKYSAGPVRVVWQGKIPEIDVVGPAGGPDGQPDEVIELELPRAVLERIVVWDLQADGGAAHWTSAPNPQWWLIAALPSPRKLAEEQAGVRLCFPEFGQLRAARSAVLQGIDDTGAVHLKLPIRTGRGSADK